MSASFELSAPTLDACPPATLPEIAVGGRSNVGKSSLLNAFAGQRGLARVSRTPGRTRLLNFFKITLRHPKLGDRVFRWVDLPGYGFAAAHASIRETFGPMIEGYLQGRGVLCELMVLIDVRRGAGDQDRQLLEYAAARQLPARVVGTKADKLGKAERGLVLRELAASVGLPQTAICLTSASTGLGLGDDGRGGLARLLARRIDDARI
ncbi:MAG: ribosome biogenesis GTP-binding protein YsxC [Myxococcales bacterium]|nr:ribosome biogenesis GTP-binding protein YsxC [Myxococcales bacterium]